MPQPLGSSYELDALIGRGGMGEVWRGRSKDDGRALAFKLMIPELAQDEALVARFLRERSILTRLDSPYVVQVYDMVAESGRLAIVMQLADGPDLRAELARVGTFAPAEALRLTSLILRGVAAAHALGITHRDLKPGNVLLARDQAGSLLPKVSDFGIAAMAEESTRLTSSSAVVGTPIYMAPEQADHGDVGPAADLYSAGIMLYELLAGVPPFTGRPMAVLRAHVERAPGRIPGLPDEVWHLLTGLLAKDPAARFPSATAAADAIDQLVPGLAGMPPLPRFDAPPTSRPSPVPASTTVYGTTYTGPRPVGGSGGDQPPTPVPGQPGGGSPPGNRSGLYIGVAAAVVALLVIVAVVASSGGNEGAEVTTGQDGRVPSSLPTAGPTPAPSVSAVGSQTPVGGAETPSSPPATAPAQSESGASKVWLADLDVITSGGGSVRTGSQNLDGTTYTRSVYTFTCGRPDVEYEYVLGRKYGQLAGLLGLNDESPDTMVRMQLEVSVDGEVAFQRIVGYGEFIPINIDVSGGLRMSLRTTLIEDNGKVGCASGGTFVLGDPTLAVA